MLSKISKILNNFVENNIIYILWVHNICHDIIKVHEDDSEYRVASTLERKERIDKGRVYRGSTVLQLP